MKTIEYTVIHKGGVVLFPIDEFKGAKQIFPAKECEYAEFDTEKYAQEYIKVNNLKYEFANED